MLRLLLLLLAVLNTATALSCLACQHFTVSTNDAELDAMILTELGVSDDSCRNNPDAVDTFIPDCETCGTIYVTFNITGTLEETEITAEVSMVMRGCGRETEGCVVSDPDTEELVNAELEEAGITMLTVTDMDGGQCTCLEEDCNKELEDDIPTEDDLMSCIQCGWVNSVAKRDALRGKLPMSIVNKKCRSAPEELEPEACDLDEICVTAVVGVSSYAGIDASASIIARGCVSKDVLDDAEEGCHRADDFMDEVGELLGTDNYKATSAGICFCEGEECNKDTTNEVIGVAESVKCASCSWVDAESKLTRLQNLLPGDMKNKKCKQDPDAIDEVMCDPGQVCASLRLDVNSIEDISVPATLWARTCVDKEHVEDVKKGCHNATEYPEQVAAVLGTADYDGAGGSVCFCENDGCNTQDQRKMEQKAGMGPECYVCSFAKHDDSDVSKAMKGKMADTASKCRLSDELSDVKTRRCNIDEMCYSMKLDVSSLDGDDLEDATIWYRGCVSKDLVEDLDEGCFPALNHMDPVDEIVPDGFEISGGGICRCNDNMCNTYTSADMNEGATLQRCISCNYAEVTKDRRKYHNKLPGKSNIKCRDQPGKIEPTYCDEPDQRCASLILEVTSFEGLVRPARLVRRCCVDREPVADVTGCAEASTYPDQVSSLLDTEDYKNVSGGICFCDGDVCNKQSKKEIQDASGVNKCILSCVGMRNGMYNKCFSCEKYMVCKGGRGTTQTCKGKRKEFDSAQNKCVRKSPTCPVDIDI